MVAFVIFIGLLWTMLSDKALFLQGLRAFFLILLCSTLLTVQRKERILFLYMVLNRYSRKAATARLARLRRPISLQVFTLGYEDGPCRENRQAAEELAEISSRLQVEIHEAMASGDLLRKYRIDSLPALVFSAKESPEFRMYGAPTGFALPAFLDGLVSIASVGELKHELIPFAQALADTSSSLFTLRLDLVLSRREAQTVEAAPALWRAVQALHSLSSTPRLLPALRIIEDFPRWATYIGEEASPCLFVDGELLLAWPFSDKDILEELSTWLSKRQSEPEES